MQCTQSQVTKRAVIWYHDDTQCTQSQVTKPCRYLISRRHAMYPVTSRKACHYLISWQHTMYQITGRRSQSMPLSYIRTTHSVSSHRSQSMPLSYIMTTHNVSCHKSQSMPLPYNHDVDTQYIESQVTKQAVILYQNDRIYPVTSRKAHGYLISWRHTIYLVKSHKACRYLTIIMTMYNLSGRKSQSTPLSYDKTQSIQS